jgi:hypothetical protein
MNGPKTWEDHLGGKPHRKNVQKQWPRLAALLSSSSLLSSSPPSSSASSPRGDKTDKVTSPPSQGATVTGKIASAMNDWLEAGLQEKNVAADSEDKN